MWLRDDYLADMPSMRHVPESGSSFTDAKSGMTNGTKAFHDRRQHRCNLLRFLTAKLRQIEDTIPHVGPNAAHAVGIPDVTLSDFDEGSPMGEQSKTLFDVFAGQRIQHDIDAAASSAARYFFGKMQCT